MMLLLGVWAAFAQDEVCSAIYTAGEFNTAILEAERLLAKGEIDRALPVLTQTYDLVRCSGGLVPSRQLAAFADLSARVYFYNQDADIAMGWARLANTIEPDHNWGELPDDHPLFAMLEEAGEPATIRGEGGFRVEKGGSVFYDGRFLPEPSVKGSMPHLVQVFDGKGHLVRGKWQDGGAFPAWLLQPEALPIKSPRYYDGLVITPRGKPPVAGGGGRKIAPLTLVGAGLVGVSAVLYGLAGASHASFNCDVADPDCDKSAERLTRVRTRTNLLVLGAGATFMGGVAVGLTGVLTSDGAQLGIQGRF